jgi:hypothetical protein
VQHHLPAGVEVRVLVGRERRVEEGEPVPFEQPVEDDLLGAAALALGDGGDRGLGRGLVVGGIAEREDAVEPGDEEAGDGRAGLRLLAEQLGADLGVAEAGDSVGEGRSAMAR